MKEQRIRILKMVEEGKLKVEEALTLLEELEKAQQTMEQKQEQIINELSSAVSFDEAKKDDPVKGKSQSTKEKIFDFVDSALKKIKDLDFDLNFGQSVEISHIFQHGDVSFKDMDIDLANGSVRIAAWDQPDVRIECQAKVYRVENQDQARQNFLRDVHFMVENEKLSFVTQQKWMKVDALIYVPKAQYDSARVRVFNGTVSGEVMDIEDLRVKTANGKILLNRVNGKKAEIETVNGKIKVMSSLFDELEAETIRGSITLDGDFKRVETQSLHGNISFHVHGTRSESISAKAATGGIDILIAEELPVMGDLNTNLGNFQLNLTGVQVLEEKSEMIQKSLRFQSVNHPEKMVKIYCDTKTGSITVQKSQNE